MCSRNVCRSGRGSRSGVDVEAKILKIYKVTVYLRLTIPVRGLLGNSKRSSGRVSGLLVIRSARSGEDRVCVRSLVGMKEIVLGVARTVLSMKSNAVEAQILKIYNQNRCGF